jgi:hypothetical protein
MKLLGETRRCCSGAACALLVACLWIPALQAHPQSLTTGSPSGAAKASTKKKHHKAASSSSSTSASTHKVASRGKRGSRRRPRGQQKIDSERAQAIQEALIRERYLTGEATGTWNQASEDAMRRYQADHGWQSKTVPDSRALIKLGLGPSHDHLLNPESAMTTAPDGPRPTSLHPASHSADPVAPASKKADPPPAASAAPANPSSPQ